ncbi:hypothetical protein Tco_0038495 [Tanacetum coccineum]
MRWRVLNIPHEEGSIRRSERTHRAPNRLCLNVEVEEHSLGDLNEPTSYKAAMLDLESNKWIDAMNAEIQSMMDNMQRVTLNSMGLIMKKRSHLSLTLELLEFSLSIAASMTAVHYANEPRVQKGARHYQRRYHYVRECVELGKISILKVHTDNNLVDPFTKALSNRKLTQHARGMGLRPASSFM